MANDKSTPKIDTAYSERVRRRRRAIMSFESKFRSNRSFAEKIADSITSFCGSIEFLVLNTVWFLLWIVLNVGLIPNFTAFDPYPFSFLTMVVSLEAIFLSIFVLITQNRQSKIQDLRSEIDMHVNMVAEEEITKVMQMINGLYKGLKLNVDHDPELEEMMKPLDRNVIEKRLEEQMNIDEGVFSALKDIVGHKK